MCFSLSPFPHFKIVLYVFHHFQIYAQNLTITFLLLYCIGSCTFVGNFETGRLCIMDTSNRAVPKYYWPPPTGGVQKLERKCAGLLRITVLELPAIYNSIVFLTFFTGRPDHWVR